MSLYENNFGKSLVHNDRYVVLKHIQSVYASYYSDLINSNFNNTSFTHVKRFSV